MSQLVNFLPSWYLQQRQQRRQRQRQLVLIALVGLLILSWYLGKLNHLAYLEAQVQNLELQAGTLRLQLDHEQKLKDQLRQLEQQKQLQQTVLPPLRYAQVIAALTQLLPSSAALGSLSIQEESRPLAPTADRSGSSARNPGRSSSKALSPQRRSYLTIRLLGWAEQDQLISDFLERLIQHPAFQEVKLIYNRPAQVWEFSVREFRIEMSVPLDRPYLPAQPLPAQEVAHVE